MIILRHSSPAYGTYIYDCVLDKVDIGTVGRYIKLFSIRISILVVYSTIVACSSSVIAVGLPIRIYHVLWCYIDCIVT